MDKHCSLFFHIFNAKEESFKALTTTIRAGYPLSQKIFDCYENIFNCKTP